MLEADVREHRVLEPREQTSAVLGIANDVFAAKENERVDIAAREDRVGALARYESLVELLGHEIDRDSPPPSLVIEHEAHTPGRPANLGRRDHLHARSEPKEQTRLFEKPPLQFVHRRPSDDVTHACSVPRVQCAVKPIRSHLPSESVQARATSVSEGDSPPPTFAGESGSLVSYFRQRRWFIRELLSPAKVVLT